jgi:hypothetical protein
MRKTRDHVRKPHVRCPECGRPVESETIVRTGPGAARIFSAEPGELTQCECRKLLEYVGQPGKLAVKRASPDRVRAFREVEQGSSAEAHLASIVEYVRICRRMPKSNPLYAVNRRSGIISERIAA